MTETLTTPGREGAKAYWPHFVAGIGLLLIAIVFALGGIAEGGSHSIDDVVICLLALGGIGWMIVPGTRRSQSMVPLGLLGGALIMKLIALAIEHGDSGDLGDDTAAILFLVVFLVISAICYFVARPKPTAPQVAVAGDSSMEPS